jgi:hypothetical protein
MTAGNYGTPEPENDDPFAYLYHSEGDASGSEPGQTVAQPGVPRTSYNQVKRVGERQYGNAGATAAGGYGYPPQAPTQQVPQQGQPTQYAPQQPPQPPQQAPGGRRAARGGSGGGPNNKVLLIGAVAVVAVVAIIISAVMIKGSGAKSQAGGSKPSATSGANSAQPAQSASSSSSDSTAGALPGTTDAATLTLAGGATTATDVKGAKAAGGKYVAGMQTVGASATWTVNAPDKGAYTLFVNYGVPGTDATSTLAINGQKRSQALSLKNYAKAASGDWEKGWTNTYAWIDLNKGQNTIALSCDTGNQCNFYLDQVQLKSGQVTG